MAEHEPGVITADESREFRRQRLALLVTTVLAFPAFALAKWFPWPAMIVTAIDVTLYVRVMLWPCPRCGKFYGLRFGLIGIAWPWVNHCLHCDSELAGEEN